MSAILNRKSFKQRKDILDTRKQRIPVLGDNYADQDDRIIKEYNAIPDYTIIEASDSLEKQEARKKKQSMVGEYQAAVNRKVGSALNDFQTERGANDTIPTLAGGNWSKIFDSKDYKQASSDIAPYLEKYGVTQKNLEDYYGKQAMEGFNQQLSEYASEHPVIGTAVTAPYLGTVGAVTSGVTDLTNYLAGKPIGSSQTANEQAKMSNAITGQISQDIRNNANTEFGRNVGGLAYDAAASSADYLSNLVATGFNPAAALGLMAYKSGVSTLNEQKEKDTSAEQKLLMAGISGSIEALTEKIPMDDLFKLAKTKAGKSAIKSVLFGVGKQAAEEGVEEFVSEIANTIADWGVNGGESDYSQSVAGYMAQGMTEQEARNQARLDTLGRAGYAGAAGALSGGAMGGFASARGAAFGGNQNEQITPEVANEMIRQEPAQRQNAIPSLFDYNYNTDAESDFNTAQNAQLAEMMDRARRLNVPTSEEELQGSLNAQLAEAMRQNATQNAQPIIPELQQPSAENVADNAPVLQENVQNEAISEERQPQFDTTINPNYGTKSVEGMKDFTKQTRDLVNMYGTPEVKEVMYPKFVNMLNEYIATGDANLFNQAFEYSVEMDQKMRGRTYTRKKGTHTVSTYANDALPEVVGNFVDEFNNSYKGQAQSQSQSNPIPVLQDTAQNADTQKRRRDEYRTMALDARGGSGDFGTVSETIPTIREVHNADGTTSYTGTLYADPADASQFATNTLRNSDMFQDSEAQRVLNEEIEKGTFNKERGVISEAESKEEARNNIAADRDAVLNRLENTQHIDGIMLDESMILTNDAIEVAKQSGNWDEVIRLAKLTQSKITDAARALQATAKYTRNAVGSIMKTERVIQDETDAYFNRGNKNKSKREACGRLAKILAEIGNDHTNDPDPRQPRTFKQLKQGVINELGRESSSIFGEFDDTDIDYLTRMLDGGYSKEEIQQALEQKIATGRWRISDADLAEVTALFEQAERVGIDTRAGMELEQRAYSVLAKYLPDSSFMDKWNAWRYLSMLGNARTHGRNVIGNTLFGSVTQIKDSIAGTLEALFLGNGAERTKTVLPTDTTLLRESRADADNVWRDLTQGGSKWDMKSEVAGQRRIFKNRLLEGARKFNSNALTAEDNWALRNKYQMALARYLQANGKDASIFKSNNQVDMELLDRARKYAVKEAQIATFHEDSKLADLISRGSRALHESDSVAAKALGYAMDAILPFKKTPINVLKQGAVEYNPMQIIHGLYDAVAHGDNPTKAIDEIARGLTGSGIMALGAWLCSKGILRSKGDEDKEDLDKLSGEQDFSININGHSYTIDWAAPAALPLFVGAEVYNASQGKFDFWHAMSSISDPVIEMSMLQGLKNTIESVATYDKGKTTGGELMTNIGLGYASQGVPTIIGQVARAADDTRRSTYTGTSGTADTLLKGAKKIQNKIPGLSSMNQPYVDAWGETQENTGGSFLGRLAYNMLSPGYYANVEKSDIEQELYRLTDEKSKGNIEVKVAVPSLADKKYKGQQLTPEQYTQRATIQGQNARENLESAIANKRYAAMDDEEKAELLNNILLFSNALSNKEMFDYDIEGGSYKKKYEAYQHGGIDGLIDYMELKKSLDGSQKTEDLLKALDESGMSNEDKIYYFKQNKKDYSTKAQYLDSINEAYAYDWYRIQAEYGTKKDAMLFGILASDLPEEEIQALSSVANMKDDELKFRLLMAE